MPNMSDALFDRLQAIYAYDIGCTDSGVKDEVLRARLAAELDSLSAEELRVRLSRWVRDTYLSEDAISKRFGWEDAMNFCKWIADGDYRG